MLSNLVFAATFLLSAAFTVSAKDLPQPKLRTEPLTVLTAKGAKLSFNVEIALSEHEREMGLMFRPAPKAGEGMLFIAQDEQPRAVSMWMKNTPAALDMLFIESDGRIASLKEHAEPFSQDIISSGVPVSAVLELADGTLSSLGIKIGDHINNRHFCGPTGCAVTH